MYYDKRIRYIDYLENGEKRRNCGYIKITVTGGRLLLEMQVKGLYATDDVASEVMLEGAGKEHRIGTVNIRQGSGSFRWEMQDPAHQGEEILLDEGLSYGRLEKVAVHLSSRRSLYCTWRELETMESAVTERGAENAVREQKMLSDETRQPEDDRVPNADVLPETPDEKKVEAYIVPQPERVDKAERAVSPVGQSEWEKPESAEGQTDRKEAAKEGESAGQEEQPGQGESAGQKEQSGQGEAAGQIEQPKQGGSAKLEERPRQEGSAGPERQTEWKEPAETEEQPEQEELHTAESQQRGPQEPPSIPMSEDKWQQLQRIYPHIRPFQDEREYLSLRPEDFVILRSSAYRLVQNSFLLHGYYNYKHLILTHVSQRNAGQYYIGVPGNFYEKEKQVAIMYGFDSFECKHEPAEDGDFGYYMIKVEL